MKILLGAARPCAAALAIVTLGIAACASDPSASPSPAQLSPLPMAPVENGNVVIDERGDVLLEPSIREPDTTPIYRLDRAAGRWVADPRFPLRALILASPDGTVFATDAATLVPKGYLRGGAYTAMPAPPLAIGCDPTVGIGPGPGGAYWVRCEIPYKAADPSTPGRERFARFDRAAGAWTELPGELARPPFPHGYHALADGRLLFDGGSDGRLSIVEFTDVGAYLRVLAPPPCVETGDAATCRDGVFGPARVLVREGARHTILIEHPGRVLRIPNGALEIEELSNAPVPQEPLMLTATGAALDRDERIWLAIRRGNNSPSDHGALFSMTPGSRTWVECFDEGSVNGISIVAAANGPEVIAFNMTVHDLTWIRELTP